MKKIRWKLGCGVVSVFIAGFLSGALALILLVAIVEGKTKQAREDPELSRELITDHLVKTLKLNEEQEQEVAIVIGDLVEEWAPIREQAQADFSASVNRHSPRIREVLTEKKQLERFSRFLEKVDDDWNLAIEAEAKRGPDNSAKALEATPE